MIFVTVGSTHFDDLVREVDRLVETGVILAPVYAQIGSGKYVPQHAQWVRYLRSLSEVEQRADLVICHGGTGTVFELLELGKPFIPVPNPALHDDHQTDFLRAVEAEGWCTCCWDLKDLGRMVGEPRSTASYARDPETARAIWEELF